MLVCIDEKRNKERNKFFYYLSMIMGLVMLTQGHVWSCRNIEIIMGWAGYKMHENQHTGLWFI